jgi:hypothetical protein
MNFDEETIVNVIATIAFGGFILGSAIYYFRQSQKIGKKMKEEKEEKRKDPRYLFEEKHYDVLSNFMVERSREEDDDEEDIAKVHVLNTALGFLGVGPGAITRWADEERSLAEATKNERTEEYRKKYVSLPQHREELLKNADKITRDYQALMRDYTVREYFERYVSPEVIKMWEENYRRLELAKFWEPEKKRTQTDFIMEKTQELKEQIKARIDAKVDFELSVKQHLKKVRGELSSQYSESVVKEIMQELEREMLKIKARQ